MVETNDNGCTQPKTYSSSTLNPADIKNNDLANNLPDTTIKVTKKTELYSTKPKVDPYEELGKRWLKGEVLIKEFQGIKLNPKQIEFVNDKSRYCLLSGGFASGKTTTFIIKLILLCVFFPGNRILLGRKTRQDVERATLPDFFDICPRNLYTHKVGAGIIEFKNGSQIMMFGLDALQSGAGQDIKKAEQAIKSLNLGAVFVDQLEEIEFRVFEALSGRLRRDVGLQQMNFNTNPANFWAYDYFKANPRPNTKLIETSMLDNKVNLSEEYINDQLTKPKRYVDRYVYGIWSPDTMVESGVFSEDYIKDQAFHIKSPLREFDGVKIYQEPKEMTYQIGIDPSDGTTDPCSIKVVCIETGEEVASFKGYVPHSVIATKAVMMALMYSMKAPPLIIPECTGAGQALVEYLKSKWDNIYQREIFNQRTKTKVNKLGFSTNYASKKLLIENMLELFAKKFPKIRERETVEQLKTFIYQDEVAQKGAGAQRGYHDDDVMALMLAFWNVKPRDTVFEEEIYEEIGLYSSTFK